MHEHPILDIKAELEQSCCIHRQASGAVLAALSLATLQGPAQAANAFLSPEARSKDLAKK